MLIIFRLLDNKTVFFDFNKNPDFAENVLPDGMTIDKNGNLWVACFNGAKVINICTKTGKFSKVQYNNYFDKSMPFIKILLFITISHLL